MMASMFLWRSLWFFSRMRIHARSGGGMVHTNFTGVPLQLWHEGIAQGYLKQRTLVILSIQHANMRSPCVTPSRQLNSDRARGPLCLLLSALQPLLSLAADSIGLLAVCFELAVPVLVRVIAIHFLVQRLGCQHNAWHAMNIEHKG